MSKPKKITLEDGAIITEKFYSGLFEYYYNRRYMFGTLNPLTKTQLQALYNNGYFSRQIKEG